MNSLFYDRTLGNWIIIQLQSEFEGTLERLCSFIRRQLRRAATEKFEVERESSHAPVSVPYLYLTPNGKQINF